ncbi:transposase [Streptomyces hygroscopicus subsp. hygroscopicus]|nr:transposase [Streptomyces hygroscopicus subsp. hygroscopicus]
MGSKYTKRYTEEFKRDAIALVDSSGKTVTAVARELGISSESLRGSGAGQGGAAEPDKGGGRRWAHQCGARTGCGGPARGTVPGTVGMVRCWMR